MTRLREFSIYEVKSVKHLTVRNVPPPLARALEREKRRRGESLNQTIIDLLSQGLGVKGGDVRRNGLKRLSGAWSAEDQARFEAAVSSLEEIDKDLWR